ncbi:transmembrane protein, partial [Cystoisospora suis]
INGRRKGRNEGNFRGGGGAYGFQGQPASFSQQPLYGGRGGGEWAGRLRRRLTGSLLHARGIYPSGNDGVDDHYLGGGVVGGGRTSSTAVGVKKKKKRKDQERSSSSSSRGWLEKLCCPYTRGKQGSRTKKGKSSRKKRKKKKKKRRSSSRLKMTRREKQMLHDLEYVRGIPVKSMSFWACLYRFFYIFLTTGGGCEGLKTHLDDLLNLTWWQQLRLLLAPLSFHTMQGTTFILIAFSIPTSYKQLPGMSSWEDFFPVGSWNDLNGVDHTVVVLVCASFTVWLVAFIFTAPFFDVLFITLGTTLRILSDYLMIRGIAISFAQQLPDTPEEENGSRFVGFAVCSLFLIRPLHQLLTLFLPTIFALFKVLALVVTSEL